MSKPKISGGPDRKAFGIDNVIPVRMGEEDPFWDTPSYLNHIDEECKSGKIEDLIIVHKHEGRLSMHWRGKNPMTTALGMLDWCKDQVKSDE